MSLRCVNFETFHIRSCTASLRTCAVSQNALQTICQFGKCIRRNWHRSCMQVSVRFCVEKVHNRLGTFDVTSSEYRQTIPTNVQQQGKRRKSVRFSPRSSKETNSLVRQLVQKEAFGQGKDRQIRRPLGGKLIIFTQKADKL